ncbi:MAG: McrC family protein [Armatimonadota bacterium]|nr:McrC family protein [Armatimonadota bacterium]
MNATPPRLIELTEYAPCRLPRDAMSASDGMALWRDYGKQIVVDYPSPLTDGQWQLTAQGWAGYVPLSSEVHLALRPKVAVSNLFRLLEYAYRLPMIFPPGLYECGSLEEFYESLANILAKRVLERARKGYYRADVSRTERLPYLRGRLDVRPLPHTPWDVNLPCRYQEHTTDIEENQILAWTLWLIARSGLCGERSRALVGQAYRTLQSSVQLLPHQPQDCLGRLYHRLNEDYRPLHALCRFFLEHTGPHHKRGDHAMLPFLVNMERLFEMFVAEWLKAHLPPDLVLQAQAPVQIDEHGHVSFQIDLVLHDAATGQALQVLDTKYKNVNQPSSEDIAQVVAYAAARGCREAILIYPARLARPLDAKIGDIRVRSVTFALDGDLERTGEMLLASIIH